MARSGPWSVSDGDPARDVVGRLHRDLAPDQLVRVAPSSSSGGNRNTTPLALAAPVEGHHQPGLFPGSAEPLDAEAERSMPAPRRAGDAPRHGRSRVSRSGNRRRRAKCPGRRDGTRRVPGREPVVLVRVIGPCRIWTGVFEMAMNLRHVSWRERHLAGSHHNCPGGVRCRSIIRAIGHRVPSGWPVGSRLSSIPDPAGSGSPSERRALAGFLLLDQRL